METEGLQMYFHETILAPITFGKSVHRRAQESQFEDCYSGELEMYGVQERGWAEGKIRDIQTEIRAH